MGRWRIGKGSGERKVRGERRRGREDEGGAEGRTNKVTCALDCVSTSMRKMRAKMECMVCCL